MTRKLLITSYIAVALISVVLFAACSRPSDGGSVEEASISQTVQQTISIDDVAPAETQSTSPIETETVNDEVAREPATSGEDSETAAEVKTAQSTGTEREELQAVVTEIIEGQSLDELLEDSDLIKVSIEDSTGEVILTQLVDPDELKGLEPVGTEIADRSLAQPEFSETEGQQILTDSELLLSGIWNSAINAIVLITTEDPVQSSFFRQPQDSTGAGFFWDDQGHIVTNSHVVQPSQALPAIASDIIVRTYAGDEYVATLVGSDPYADLAVLKIEGLASSDYDTLPIGDSSMLVPGMMAITLGHPFGPGQGFSMTHGIVSGVEREIQTTTDQTLLVPGVIQTDADMNPGNSGGPLLDSSGRIVGVNTQIRSLDNTNSGVGFALPINLVARVVDGIIENGAALHSYMGISMAPLTDEIVALTGVPADFEGIYISVVHDDTPASQAGLKGDSGFDRTNFRATDLQGDGDVIVSFNGEPVTEIAKLRQYLTFEASPGDVVVFQVRRNGRLVNVPLTLGSRVDYTE